MKVAEAQVYKGKKIRYGEKIEELPDEKIPFSREPYHDLDTLVQEVKDEMFGNGHQRHIKHITDATFTGTTVSS